MRTAITSRLCLVLGILTAGAAGVLANTPSAIPNVTAGQRAGSWSPDIRYDSGDVADNRSAVTVQAGSDGAGGTSDPHPIYVDDDGPNDPGPGNPSISDPMEDGSASHPFDTIQEAIDTASTGETVLVLAGTYSGIGNRDLHTFGKIITVRSTAGAASTIIDCQGSEIENHRGFVFNHGENRDTTIEGFTVRNGWDSLGGGMIVGYGASPTIRECVVENCVANGAGGGLYIAGAGTALIEACVIRDCQAVDGAGCAISEQECNPVFRNGRISSNSASWGGGGVYCACGASPVFEDVTIDGNSSVHGGGGLSLFASATLVRCRIVNNSSPEGQGGGIDCQAHVKLILCELLGNTSAPYYGGALVVAGEANSAELVSCLLSGNSAPSGSALFTGWGAVLTVVGCTIVHNTGGPAVSENLATLTMNNSIVWANPYGSLTHWGGVSVEFCDVQGGITGNGNIDRPPLFVDADGPDDDPETSVDNDYRLRSVSPCIDAGNNADVPADTADLDGDGDTTEPLPFDLAGGPRFFDAPLTPDTGLGTPPIVDMGAHEYITPGDYDSDGDVDLVDFKHFSSCFNGPNRAYSTAGCGDADFDSDGDVDLVDFSTFQACFNGPNRPPRCM